MLGKPELTQQIRIAVVAILEEEFETNLDLTMPWRFKLITPHGIGTECFRFVIRGPVYIGLDGLDAWEEINGITISCWNRDTARVSVRARLFVGIPYFNHAEEKNFEYANPAFPQNLIDFVASELAIWVMQNELEQEKERYRERMIA
jgi:hypothetical protein